MRLNGLLVADPENCGPDHKNDDEKDGPGINMTVFIFGNLRVIAHKHRLLSVLLVATRLLRTLSGQTRPQ
jgi:hypothetical protein